MKNPVDAFESWYVGLSRQTRVLIEVAFSYTVPDMIPGVDAAPNSPSPRTDDLPNYVLTYLRSAYQYPMEVIGRLGLVKEVVNVHMLPYSRPDMEAFLPAALAVHRARASAAGKDWLAEQLKRLERDQPRERDEAAILFVGWDDLLKGDLSTAAMWEWLATARGGTSYLLEPEPRP